VRYYLMLLLLLPLHCFGKQYTLSQTDFTNQVTAEGLLQRQIYCTNKKGEKVWLFYSASTILSLGIKNGKKTDVMLHSAKYKNGEIEALKFDVLLGNIGGKKILSFHINDIESFTIKTQTQESDYPYYNLDSTRSFTCSFNDSIKKDYAAGSEWVIKITPKNKMGEDTFTLFTNACYHIAFKDNNPIQYGVVMKITQDSLYISNSFNANTAAKEKLPYKICAYPVNDILRLSLKAPGRSSDKTINIEDYNITVMQEEKAQMPVLCWYSFNAVNGESRLYRSWLTAEGFIGVGEQYGHTVWYER
jgi:hypothetical protein